MSRQPTLQQLSKCTWHLVHLLGVLSEVGVLVDEALVALEVHLHGSHAISSLAGLVRQGLHSSQACAAAAAMMTFGAKLSSSA